MYVDNRGKERGPPERWSLDRALYYGAVFGLFVGVYGIHDHRYIDVFSVAINVLLQILAFPTIAAFRNLLISYMNPLAAFLCAFALGYIFVGTVFILMGLFGDTLIYYAPQGR